MQKISYQVEFKTMEAKYITPCKYVKGVMVGDIECDNCSFCHVFQRDSVNQTVACDADEKLLNKFLQDCLTALNWQRGTEADILAVLERVMEVKSYPACVENNANFRNRILTIIQEPTDAKA